MRWRNNLVEIHALSFQCHDRIIFDNISMQFPRGKIIAIMGPSGVGKTTLMRLIGGQLRPNSGEIWIDDDNISSLSRRRLYNVRKKISMLFQSTALFTDLNVFENVAFPLRQHTCLPEPVLHSMVMMKLEAVGLRRVEALMPSELSGGMERRVALARAIVLDPHLIMFDEPFVGQDPMTMGVLVKLIDELNYALGVTCIVVSHDIPEVLSIADYAYIIAEQHVMAEGTPDSLRVHSDAQVRSFLAGIIDGCVPFNTAVKKGCETQLMGAENLFNRWYFQVITSFGRQAINFCYGFGRSIYMLFNALVGTPAFQQQWLLLIQQVYSVGVLSLVIVIVSGLFIGIVLGLQGYITLSTYNAESNVGMMVALSLLRELGPVVTALLFAGRSGASLTAEIALMKATEQLSSLEMMAVDPLRWLVAPRFWAGVISMPLLTAIFIAVGIWGNAIVSVEWKGIDNGFFWSAMHGAVDWHKDLINCVIKSVVFAITVTWIALFYGYDAVPTSEGVGRATTRTVVHASLAILWLDFVLTVLMFGN